MDIRQQVSPRRLVAVHGMRNAVSKGRRSAPQLTKLECHIFIQFALRLRCMRPLRSNSRAHPPGAVERARGGWPAGEPRRAPGGREREQAGAISRSLFFFFSFSRWAARASSRASGVSWCGAGQRGPGCAGVFGGERGTAWVAWARGERRALRALSNVALQAKSALHRQLGLRARRHPTRPYRESR